jgi:hypothetical protein
MTSLSVIPSDIASYRRLVSSLRSVGSPPQREENCGQHQDIKLLALPSPPVGNYRMASTQIKAGQIVVPNGLVGVYRVVRISPDGRTADIEKFDVSTKKSVGDPVRPISMDKLTLYKEDSSQAAARVAREAITED